MTHGQGTVMTSQHLDFSSDPKPHSNIISYTFLLTKVSFTTNINEMSVLGFLKFHSVKENKKDKIEARKAFFRYP